MALKFAREDADTQSMKTTRTLRIAIAATMITVGVIAPSAASAANPVISIAPEEVLLKKVVGPGVVQAMSCVEVRNDGQIWMRVTWKGRKPIFYNANMTETGIVSTTPVPRAAWLALTGVDDSPGWVGGSSEGRCVSSAGSKTLLYQRFTTAPTQRIRAYRYKSRNHYISANNISAASVDTMSSETIASINTLVRAPFPQPTIDRAEFDRILALLNPV